MTSKKFQKRQREKYNLKFKTLSTLSKSFLAERAIKLLKTRLSLALESRKEILEQRHVELTTASELKLRRWIELLQARISAEKWSEYHITQKKFTSSFTGNLSRVQRGKD